MTKLPYPDRATKQAFCPDRARACIKLVAARILPAVSGGFQPPGRGPDACSSGETPDPRRQKASLMQPCARL